MAIEHILTTSPNLSVAWAQVMLKLLQPGVSELSPVIVNIQDLSASGEAIEQTQVRQLLDTFLKPLGKSSVQTVANTIFPYSLWRPDQEPSNLYSRYDAVWPKIAKCPLNKYGVYFRRLTSFLAKDSGATPVNQLKIITECLQSGTLHRRSALQAAIFDPSRDHRSTPYLSFPCLQHVTFARLGDTGLGVTGFYTLQHQLEKAYGNYLGLARLGRFVAHHTGRTLVQVTCVAAAVTTGNNYTKAQLAPLRDELLAVGMQPAA